MRFAILIILAVAAVLIGLTIYGYTLSPDTRTIEQEVVGFEQS